MGKNSKPQKIPESKHLPLSYKSHTLNIITGAYISRTSRPGYAGSATNLQIVFNTPKNPYLNQATPKILAKPVDTWSSTSGTLARIARFESGTGTGASFFSCFTMLAPASWPHAYRDSIIAYLSDYRINRISVFKRSENRLQAMLNLNATVCPIYRQRLYKTR